MIIVIYQKRDCFLNKWFLNGKNSVFPKWYRLVGNKCCICVLGIFNYLKPDGNRTEIQSTMLRGAGCGVDKPTVELKKRG